MTTKISPKKIVESMKAAAKASKLKPPVPVKPTGTKIVDMRDHAIEIGSHQAKEIWGEKESPKK